MMTGFSGSARAQREAEQRHADVFVVFGITGDLAKVMTFRSLYRLEARGLLDCPIVGVAVDDWSVDRLVERARESIVGTGETLDEDVFKRFAARLSYVAGDFGDEATYERVADARSWPNGFSITMRADVVSPASARPCTTRPKRNGGISR